MLFCLWDVAAQVQGIAEPHHNGASGRSADAIKVVADGFDRSIALNGIRQMQCLGHGTTLED